MAGISMSAAWWGIQLRRGLARQGKACIASACSNFFFRLAAGVRAHSRRRRRFILGMAALNSGGNSDIFECYPHVNAAWR